MLTRPRVLLINNEPEWECINDPLNNEGFDLLKARNIEEVNDKVNLNPPDIILLDLMMAEDADDNIMLYLKSCGELENIPVIVVIDRNNIEEGIKGLEAGAVDYIGKPFYLREVVAKIRIHLRLKEYEERLTRKNHELEKYSALLLEFNAKLEELARRDELTQIWNRRAFNEQIAQLHNYSLRYQRPYSIIIIDLDHFKKYNDLYGHQKGDYVLKTVAESIEKTCRLTDFVARYGGEEIMVLLPETGEEEAVKIAERIIKSVRELNIKHELNDDLDVITVSVGLATYLPGSSNPEGWEKLLKRADEALYRAKETGRNRLCKQ
ncbi:MAG: diguanylate cyclase [Syntrophomonas sp.]